MNADEETKYDAVLRELTKLVGTWQAYQVQITAEIVEYKKTINSAIGMLAQEAFKFQADTKDRLETDATVRATRQRHTDRKDIAILSGVGCLIAVNLLAIVGVVAVLIVLNWK